MYADEFGFAKDDWDRVGRDGLDGGQSEEVQPLERVDAETLEEWFDGNRALWNVGIILAAQARRYRREYNDLPFNKTGWFSPN